MSVEVERSEDSIRLANAHLELSVDLTTLEMELRSRTNLTRLRGFRPRVITERGALLPSERVLDGYGTIRTRSGVATRVHIETRLSARLWLCLDLDLADDWPGVAIGLELSNRSFDAVRVDALDPLWWSQDRADGLLVLDHPDGTEILEMGFHSDAPARWRKLGAAPWLQPFSRARAEDRGPFTPAPSWGVQVSDFMTVLRGAGHEGLVIGFMSHERFLSFMLARAQSGQLLELTASCFTEALQVMPRSRLRSERLWLGIEWPGQDGLATWAAWTGREMQAPIPGRQLMGSFAPHALQDVATLRDALSRAASLELPGLVFEIGTEYAPALGDWHTTGDRFPDGLGALAQEIREAKLVPRLWIAPFLVSSDSGLARRHPNWILRDAEGNPISPSVSFPERWGRVWVLDCSHPEVVDWLRKLGDTVRGLGFDQLGLAHLNVGLLPGARARPELGTAEAYREALRALRGPHDPGHGARLLGRKAPLGPSVGLIDDVRCGPDWGPRWSARLGPRGVDPQGSAEVSVRNALVRAPLHQRLWLQELGPLQLAGASTELDRAERMTLAVLAAACGGPPALGDAPQRLDRETMELFRQLCPASGRAADAITGRNDGLTARFPDGSMLVLRINFSRRSTTLRVDLDELGVDGPVRVWDILGQRFLSVKAGHTQSIDVPGHGCLWLRITPLDDRPRLLASTLHLCGGALEGARLRELPSGALAVRLQLPGPRQGDVFVARHRHQLPVAACVGFVDDLEFALAEVLGETKSSSARAVEPKSSS